MLQRLNNLIGRMLLFAIDRSLPPPSPQELALLKELQDAFRILAPINVSDMPPSEARWASNLNRLRDLMLTDNPREFLRWDVVQDTMFVASAPYLGRELAFIKRTPAWSSRWRQALRESPVGHPVPYPFFPSTSGNLIHHAYHLAQFEEKTGIRVSETNFVFEFGGGYGSMCRLFHALGFHGKYVIFDLPFFCILQKFYLKSIGVPLLSLDEFNTADRGVVCISDCDKTRLFLDDEFRKLTSMFIATWSISETPLSFRNSILSKLGHVKACLIAYQHVFGEVNNLEFFKKWRDAFDTGVVWHDWEIPHLPGNSYLVGRRAGI
jgi:hypothetical protein